MLLALAGVSSVAMAQQKTEVVEEFGVIQVQDKYQVITNPFWSNCIIRKSKFPQNPKRSVRFSGKRTKRSVQKRKARNTQKAETKVL